MPFLNFDLYIFGDQEAAGMWRREHQQEHTLFVTTLAGLAKPRFIEDIDLMSWDESRQFQTLWLTAHEEAHQQLRDATGVSGVNLADVDLKQEVEFYEWIDVHNSEHALLRAALGL